MNTEMLKAMFASGAVSAAVAFGVVHAAMPKEAAPRVVAQLAAARPAAPAAAAPRQSAAISAAESSSIREAYSDGGYQDWLEHQKAMP